MDLNTFTCTGRLTKDAQLRELPSGMSVCELRLAVTGMGRHQTAGFIDVAVYGPRGEAVAPYLTKGRLVGASGRLEFAEWTAEDGSKRHDYTIVGDVEFIASYSQQGSPDAPVEEAVAA
jgi:single-strand DNA-binding protein